MKDRAVCWSCGKEVNGDRCPDPACRNEPVISTTAPSVDLPICGGKKQESTGRIPDVTKIMPYRCCRCGHLWICNYIQLHKGTCPHCGASGEYA